jgi:hypothetical protein
VWDGSSGTEFRYLLLDQFDSLLKAYSISLQAIRPGYNKTMPIVTKGGIFSFFMLLKSGYY